MSRADRGATAHLSGGLAEDNVLRLYLARGAALLARRWRRKGGEIDLILRDGPVFVFVEVKSAPTHAMAAERIQPAQARRIMAAAEEYLAAGGHGLSCDMRFDAALVDHAGRVEIVADAFSGF